MKKKVFFAFFVVSAIFLLPVLSNADIIIIKASGVVNPVMAEYISKSIDEAVKEKAGALVIELDTPGGLDASMRLIVKKIIASETPVVVYVSPSGSRAASAGVFITLSAHVAAMAPGTNIGAAHPVALDGKMDKTMSEKAENDAAAYIKSIAEKRGRDVKWAENSVRKSISATESEALKKNIIDIVVPDTASLLKAIHGREVETAAGKRVINTKDVRVKYHEINLRHKLLNLISDPNVAYMLLMLGFYGIFFELTNPGAVFPGVFGAISLILAFYSLQTLPVNYAGLLLIILGIIFFILEIKIVSYGLLTLGGIIAMFIGSLMLFESPLPFLKLSMKVILPTVVLTALFFTLTIRLALKAYRQKPITGMEGLIGIEGVAKTDVNDKGGTVFVHGEIWKAWSDEMIKAGEKVIVVAIENLKLKVKRKGD